MSFRDCQGQGTNKKRLVSHWKDQSLQCQPSTPADPVQREILPLPTQCSAHFYPCRPSAARTSSPTDPVQRKLLSLATQCSEAFSQCRPIAAFSPYWPSAKHSLLPLPRQHSLPINATAKRDPGARLRKIESKTTLRTRTQNILTHTGKRHEGVKFG